MEEIFDSEHYNVRYDKETDSAVLIWKEYSETDNFRTPLMKSADIIRKHQCKDLVVDRSKITEISDKDKHWAGRIFIPALKHSGCQRIIIVSGEDKPMSLKEYPFDILSGNFSLKSVPDIDEALSLIMSEKTGGVSEEVRAMTREDALKFLELPDDASWEEIDEKFWILSKNYRKIADREESEKKLNDLSAIYDIATGKRDEREKAAQIRAGKKKFLGKTSDEWLNYISYTWYKYLIAIVIIVVAANLLYTIFLKPGNDVTIISVGHFVNEGDYLDNMTSEFGYTNPYILTVNLAVPNELGEAGDPYSEQSSAAAMMTSPDIIVTDERTCRYYFETYADMSAYYESLADVLPPEVYAGIEPVFCSEQEFQELGVNYEMDTTDRGETYDDTEVLIGIKINDPDLISELGYSCLWPDEDPNIIISIGGSCDTPEKSEEMITYILSDMAS